MTTQRDEQFYRMIDFLPCAIEVLSPVDDGHDFVTSWINPIALKIENKSSQEVIGQSLKKKGCLELIERCRRVYKGKISETFGRDLIKEGEVIGWLEITISPGANDDLVMIYRDLSETQLAFPPRDNSATLLQSLFNATPDWIFVKDRDFRYIFINDGFANALQVEAKDFLGKNDEEAGFPLEMIYGNEKKGIRGFRADDTEVLATAKTIHNAYDPAVFADGSVHVFDTHKMPLYNDQGETCGVLGIARDITPRKKIEDALAQSEKLSRALLEATHDAALLVSVQGDVLVMNGRCKTLFANLCVGENFFGVKLFDESVLKEVVEKEEVVCIKGEYIQENVYDITFYPVLDDSEQIYEIAIFIRDMTNEVKLAEQLKQSEKMRAIGHLAGGIAHDFNNQLAGIMGYLELLEPRLVDETLSRYAKNALKGANRAADLTKQLLAFSRKGKNLCVLVNMHELVEEVVAILERSFDKRITIKTSLHNDCICTDGVPTQLQNAILNLALNARDAMSDNGILTISTDIVEFDQTFCRNSSYDIEAGAYVKVSVEDNGHGISKKMIDRIFEPFFTTKSEGCGVGMGLSAVYGTVNNHNGAIIVDSIVDKGTKISLFFLKSDACYKTNVEKKKQMNKGQGDILIVDDEEMVAEIASEMLKELGYKTKIFYNGRDALDYYGQNMECVDLVLFDMIMPGMNGFKLFQELVAINPDLKGVVMSGYGIDGQVQEVLDIGAKGFLAKPFTLEELSSELKENLM